MEAIANGEENQKEVVKMEISEKEANCMEETDLENEAVSVEETDLEQANGSTILLEPKVGMEFGSFEEVKAFYTRYADLMGFGVRIQNSSHDDDLKLVRRATLACSRSGKAPDKPSDIFYSKRLTSRTDCKARLRLRFVSEGKYLIVDFVGEHNHELLNQKMMKFLPSKRKTLKGNQTNELNAVSSIGVDRIKTTFMVESGGLSLEKQDVRNILYRVRALKFGQGDADALQQYFLTMQLKNPHFFYLVDLDELGILKNVFWADSRSRAVHKYFDDVVTFDTTYVTGNYNLPLALFLGVNHHGQSILMGCGLLSEGTAENYVWLLRTWSTCMSGRAPKAIIIDHVQPIMDAVEAVFPQSRYRLCLKNIMRSFSHERGCDEYKIDCIKNVVYESLTVEDFEENWKSMVKNNGLQDNHLLCKMYDLRNMWAPAFIKDMFWPDMSTIQWSESPGSFFDHHVNTKTTLKQFIEQYDLLLQLKYEKEANADFASCYKKAPLKTLFYMEEQLAEMYTIGLFKKFQEEILGMMYCDLSVIGSDGPNFTYMVIEHVRIKLTDAKSKLLEKKYNVFFNDKDLTLRCICRSFEYRGILCRHALTVLRNRGLDKIPRQYILDRWRKDLDRTYVEPDIGLRHVSQDSNNSSNRYEDVYLRCIKLAELASLSPEKYKQVTELISNALKELIMESNSEKSQIESCQTGSSQKSFCGLRGQEMNGIIVNPLKQNEGNLGTSDC